VILAWKRGIMVENNLTMQYFLFSVGVVIMGGVILHVILAWGRHIGIKARSQKFPYSVKIATAGIVTIGIIFFLLAYIFSLRPSKSIPPIWPLPGAIGAPSAPADLSVISQMGITDVYIFMYIITAGIFIGTLTGILTCNMNIKEDARFTGRHYVILCAGSGIGTLVGMVIGVIVSEFSSSLTGIVGVTLGAFTFAVLGLFVAFALVEIFSSYIIGLTLLGVILGAIIGNALGGSIGATIFGAIGAVTGGGGGGLVCGYKMSSKRSDTP